MDSDFPFPHPTTKTQAQHLRSQCEASVAFRALNTQPDPDMERVLVALGCDGDSLHDLLVAAEAMRAEVERLRAAGDALAVRYRKTFGLDGMFDAELRQLRQWEAARRG